MHFFQTFTTGRHANRYLVHCIAIIEVLSQAMSLSCLLHVGSNSWSNCCTNPVCLLNFVVAVLQHVKCLLKLEKPFP